MTFSIVGYDPHEQAWGVAVQSKFLAIGSVVPWAKAGVGAVATQSQINTSYGPDALTLMAAGKTAGEALQAVILADPERWLRQVGMIDRHGRAATFTGKGCQPWAGGITGKHFAAQGNRLVDEKTVTAMAETFIQTTGTLAERLLRALDAGQAAGGDRLGQQAAALLVVKEKGGYGGFNDRMVDLRVDDHEQPIKELIHLYKKQQLIQTMANKHRVVLIKGNVKESLIHQLKRHQILLIDKPTDEQITEALTTYIHTNAFYAREQAKGYIDLDILTYMQET